MSYFAVLGVLLAMSMGGYAESEAPNDPSSTEGFPMNPHPDAEQEMAPHQLQPYDDADANSNPLQEVSMTERPGYYAVFDQSLNRSMLKIVSATTGSGGKDGGGSDKEKKKGATPDEEIDAAPTQDDLESYLYHLHDRHSGLLR